MIIVLHCVPLVGFWDKTVPAKCGIDVAKSFVATNTIHFVIDVGKVLAGGKYLTWPHSDADGLSHSRSPNPIHSTARGLPGTEGPSLEHVSLGRLVRDPFQSFNPVSLAELTSLSTQGVRHVDHQYHHLRKDRLKEQGYQLDDDPDCCLGERRDQYWSSLWLVDHDVFYHSS